ncbi:response regulator transcription factor [Phenylobacterium aquaticum]|uniref:response regulator transcription factor n=1 Tax=Phenylobacterium aquaticum TaxID=1763816 RepID=UPI0026EAF0F4|nr:response regulator [Phenylobacterium aquaticum]
MEMAASTRRPTVIVDDDPSFREALEGLIQSFGHPTLSFPGGAEALASGQLRDAACLILDVQMPGMTGLELQARLKADGDARPIIFMTAQGDPRVRARALAAGALEVLAKPFDRDVLLGLIEAAAAL